MINYLIRVQEKRRYHFFTIFIFVVFVSFIRGLEEYLFFGIGLRNSEFINFIPFYFSLAWLLTLVLSQTAKQPYYKTAMVVTIGIFLGIFPPLIDLIISGRAMTFYGYYFIYDFNNIPWSAYAPQFNYPAGEAITVYASIAFAAYYSWFKSRSVMRTLIALGLVYLVFMLMGSFLPMLVTRVYFSEITSIKQAHDMGALLLKPLAYYIAFWQSILAIVAYLIIRPQVAKHLLKRILHTVPFVITVLIGSAMANTSATMTTHASLLILLAALTSLVQNDYYDKDITKVLRQSDLYFFNTVTLLSITFIFFLNSRAVIPVLVAYAISYLYNYPFYRGKRNFPTNLKIEGIWGLSAFLAGALGSNIPKPGTEILWAALAAFGGFSLIAALKDFKDIRSDYHNKVNTVYTLAYKNNISLKTIHRLLSILVMMALLVPAVVLGSHLIWNSIPVLGVIVAITAYLTFKPLKKKNFYAILTMISLELLVILFSIWIYKGSS